MASSYGNNFDPVSPTESDGNDEGEQERFQYSRYNPFSTLGNLVRVQSSSRLIQDTEENVQLQTEDVVFNYMYQSFHLETESRNTPNPQDLLGLSRNPLTPAAEVGRRLAHLGDKLTERYSDDLDGMVSSVCEAGDDAYEAFAGIARTVFEGGIRWSRILVLMSFGYRLAVAKLQQGASGFSSLLAQIVSFIVRFIISERISRWIAQHGGWAAAINLIPGTSPSTFFLISGLAVVTVLAIVFGQRYL